MNFFQQLANRLGAFWAGLNLTQRVVVGFFSLLVVTIAVLYSGALTPTKYVPVMRDLDLAEAAAIAAQLRTANIPHKYDETGTQVLVADDQVVAARVLLAGEGFPARGKGFEIFDSNQLAVPPEVLRLNFLRAMQTELARSIERIEVVKSARVHIARPDPTPFVRERQPTTASVMLTLKPGRTLDRSQAASITALVARSVEGLKPENVSIVDTNLRQLSDTRAGEAQHIPSAQAEYQRDLERYLSQKAEDLLNAHLGAGRAIVKVSANVDFRNILEKQRKYENPGVTTAERTVESKMTGGSGGAGGVAGTRSNVRVAGGTSGGGSGSTANETTTQADYLVSTTDRQLEERLTNVSRLTVAAFVDLSAPEGENARPSISLTDAQEAIKQAIGFKQGRDEIKVTDVKLGSPLAIPEAPEPEKFWTQTTAIVALVRNAALALAALVILGMLSMLVLRRGRSAAPTPATTPAAPTADELERRAEDRRRQELEQFIELARRDPDLVARMILAMLEEEPAA